jgi:hypothetical protein
MYVCMNGMYLVLIRTSYIRAPARTYMYMDVRKHIIRVHIDINVAQPLYAYYKLSLVFPPSLPPSLPPPSLSIYLSLPLNVYPVCMSCERCGRAGSGPCPWPWPYRK